MTRAVYSKAFLSVNTGTSATYLVPDGCTAVLHNMTLWCGQDHPTPPSTHGILVALDDPSTYIWSLEGSGLLRGAYQWEGREVFTTELFLNVLVTPFAFRACGYLLTPT